jgi:hypothetical protein
MGHGRLVAHGRRHRQTTFDRAGRQCDRLRSGTRFFNPDLAGESSTTAYAQLGQLEEARYEAAEVLRINPGFTIESWKRLVVDKDPKDAEHQIDGLRKAGLPET